MGSNRKPSLVLSVSTTYTITMYTSTVRLPWALDAANQIEALVRKLGIRTIDLEPARLIAKARKQSGLSNYFDDYDFETPLGLLLDAYEREADLSLLGRVAVRMSTLLSLTTQLQIQHEFELHPEILEVPVERPIFILGLPRTGTTLLHNLLAQGLSARSPKLWELERPAPAIGPDTPSDDPRCATSARALAQTYRLVPHLRAVHSFDAEMPEECVLLFRKIFSCGSYSIDAHVPSYMNWFLKSDRLPVYRQLKKMLQLLMWKFPGHYPVLKSPLHLYSIDALLEVFPDARIIQTHRDPSTVAGSGCSLYEVLRTLYTRNPDPHLIGRDWVGGWGVAMSNAVEARRKRDEQGFFDVFYADFVGDPIPVVREIFDRFGMEWDREMEARCLVWIADNKQQKHGKHSYSTQYYGIHPEMIEQHFAEYLARFPGRRD